MKLREQIKIKVINDTRVGIGNVIIKLKVQAGYKNPYHIYFPKTDENGVAILTKADFIGQFHDHWEEGLMDYNGNIETANPEAELSLFSPDWLLKNKNLALAWPLLKHEKTKWKTRNEEYQYMITCDNNNFKCDSKIINIETSAEIELLLYKN